MKIVRQLVLVAGISGIVCCVHAQTYTSTDQSEQAQVTPSSSNNDEDEKQEGEHHELFHANEFSGDIYAVGTLAEYYLNHPGGFVKKDIRWGGGAGVNYFFTKDLGIGGDFDVTSKQSPIVDTTTGNLIFRIPLEKLHLAPYIFGGAGYQFQRIDQFVGGGGVGVEFRLCDHIGIFCDGRYLAAKKSQGYGMGRLGLRISF